MDTLRRMIALYHTRARLDRVWGRINDDGSLQQAVLLALVSRRPGIRPHEAWSELRVEANSIFHLFNALQARGLIERKRIGPKETRIHLTARGRKAVETDQRHLDNLAYLLWGDLPAEDLAAVDRFLDQLLERSR